MVLQFLKNQTGRLEIFPARVVSSSTVVVYNPSGAILVASTAATIDTTQTTITSQTQGNPNKLHLTSVSGFVVGDKYLITGTDGQTFQVTISSIDTSSNHIQVNVPPPFDIQNGDTIRATKISYNIASSHLDTYDQYYRAEFLCVTASDTFKETVFFDVVRMQFDIKSPELVKRLLTFQFPSAASRFEAGMIEEIADRAHKMVLDKIRSTGRYPQLYGSPTMFQEAYQHAVRLVFADFGMIPNAGAVDPIDYMNAYRDKMNESIHIATQGNAYDKNDDGEIGQFEKLNWSTKIIL